MRSFFPPSSSSLAFTVIRHRTHRRRSAHGVAEHRWRRRSKSPGGDSAYNSSDSRRIAPARHVDAQEARVASPRMFGLPRFHRWRTLCTARLCAGGPMWIGERRRRRRQTFCLSLSLVTAAARCRWHNVDCRRVSCSRQRQQSPSPNRAHGHPWTRSPP